MVPALVVAAAMALAGSAWAGHTDDATISADENVRLMHGATITRTQTLQRGERHYVGGVTYTIVDATAPQMDAVLEDMAAWRAILPRTKDARVVGHEGGDTLVELRQGTLLLEATYTLRVRKTGHEYRFWLDPGRPHGIEDAWGFFRSEPLAQVTPGRARSLVTYGVLVDVGPGIVRDLFEDRIRDLALTVPQRLRDYVARAPRA